MIVSSTSASSTLRSSEAKDGLSRFIVHQPNATHMSPRWGFRIFACPVCYKHAALLGLGWFISNKVDFGKSAYRSPKWFQVH